MSEKLEEAYNKIKSIILSSSSKDDFQYSENYFADKLNMSRTPIRGALQQLQSDKIIDIIPYKGIVVKELSYSEAIDLFEMRGVVEDYLIHKAVIKLNDEDFVVLEKMIKEQEKAIKNNSWDEFLDLDTKFHLYTYRHYRNETMFDVVKSFKDRFYRLRKKSLQQPGRAESSIRSHKLIVQYLKDKKPEEAIQALEEHINQLATNFKEYM